MLASRHARPSTRHCAKSATTSTLTHAGSIPTVTLLAHSCTGREATRADSSALPSVRRSAASSSSSSASRQPLHVRRVSDGGPLLGRRSLGGGAVLQRARVVPRGGGAGAETLWRRVRHLFARGGRPRTPQATRVGRALLLGGMAARRERANRGSGERRGAGDGRAESEQVAAGSARVVRLPLSPGTAGWKSTRAARSAAISRAAVVGAYGTDHRGSPCPAPCLKSV